MPIFIKIESDVRKARHDGRRRLGSFSRTSDSIATRDTASTRRMTICRCECFCLYQTGTLDRFSNYFTRQSTNRPGDSSPLSVSLSRSRYSHASSYNSNPPQILPARRVSCGHSRVLDGQGRHTCRGGKDLVDGGRLLAESFISGYFGPVKSRTLVLVPMITCR
jgi:hypothetical protein